MYKANDRVELVKMNDPDPVPVGTLGTILSVCDFGKGMMQLNMKWDNGRTLGVCIPEDQVKVAEEGQNVPNN